VVRLETKSRSRSQPLSKKTLFTSSVLSIKGDKTIQKIDAAPKAIGYRIC
jgi:hypothetical protein